MDCPNETTLSAFADGRLPRADAEAIEAHARTCTRCPDRIAAAVEVARGGATSTLANVAVAQVRPRTNVSSASTQHLGSGSRSGGESDSGRVEGPTHGGELERGASVGRYTVLALVGRGGMGEVYAAYDPELDRKIALKVLRARSSDRKSRARLLREAKAIARLSHANVVVVHDAGTFDERVFIAMEFIEGETLKQWLAETPRTRREILEVFTAAARGLHAAHVAGLVHRDFKPHNVMVSRDGSVRVMDFGLARQVDAADAADAPDRPDEAEPVLPGAETDLSFTRTGELVGTPLYMAPEQFLATRTDARTDQFSFCVALYHSLYGAHPFAGDSIDVLVARVLAGDVQPPPAKHDVPAWLRRVLLRGLSVDPAARWPSMAPLVEALEQDPTRTRRRWGAAAGVALLVGAAAVTLVRGPGRAESLCRGGPARLAGLWEPSGPPGTPRPRRDALEAAFVRAGGAPARETWARAEAGLDRYAASWLGMYRDACEATHARGEQSAETLDLRMTCLDERRAALGALTEVLTKADEAAVASAVDAVNALPALDPCADVKGLRAPTDSPRDEATRARAEDIRTRLATAHALNVTGQHDEGMRRVRGLVTEARALGYRSLIAETLEAEGEFQTDSFFVPEAAAPLEEAVWTAIAVKRDDLAARGSGWLAGYIGYGLGRREEGKRWARLSSALLDRLGPGHDLLRAWLLHNEGNIELLEGNLPAALTFFKDSLALKEKVLAPDHPDAAIDLGAIAEVLHRQGKDAEALVLGQKACDVTLRAYGPTSAEQGHYLGNQGDYLVGLGRAKEAVPIYERALALSSRGGAESPNLAFPLTGLGQAWLALERPDEARPLLEHALRLRETVNEPLGTAETRFALARSLAATDVAKERPRARELAIAARDAYAKAIADAPLRGGSAQVPEPLRAQLREIDAWLAARK